MTQQTHAMLSELSIDDKVNVRKTGRGAEPIFTGTIRKRGIIQKLIVRKNGNGFKIADGGKRFDALAWLRDHHESAAGVPVTNEYRVPIEVVDEDDAGARELSLITNIARAETHPVDRFERFSQLIEDGATRENIAATYGMPLREVDKALALGDLHPSILAAWRADEIRAENAQAFTLCKDQKTQARVFEKLKKSGGLTSRWTIRTELKADDQEVGHLLTFVGSEAYEARGGKVIARDLFEGKHVVSDTELVKTMAKEKLQAECERLTAAGWGWAALEDAMPSGWTWKWGKIDLKIELTAAEEAQIKPLKLIADDEDADWQEQEAAQETIERIVNAARARSFGPKQMAKSGCVIDLSETSDLEITYGIIKPDNAKVSAGVENDNYAEQRRERTKKTAKKKGDGTANVSNALVHRLSVQLTKAAAVAIKKHPGEALNIAIAGLLANGRDFGPGVRVSHDGLGSYNAGRTSFKSNLETVRKMKEPAKLAALADVIGAAFNFQCGDAMQLKRFQGDGLCDLLGKEMVEATRKGFDADDYFKSVPKAMCLAAITEAINADESRKVAGKPTADIKKFATANVPKTGWLPRELRTAHYDGPGAKKK